VEESAASLEGRSQDTPPLALRVEPSARRYMDLFQRISGVLGLVLLVAGLGVWAFKPGQHRLALLILVCAMFLSILHYYTLEDTTSNTRT